MTDTTQARALFNLIAIGHNGHIAEPFMCLCGKCSDLTDALMGAWQQGRHDAAMRCAEILKARVANCDEKMKQLREKGDHEYADRWEARGTEADRALSRIEEEFGLEDGR